MRPNVHSIILFTYFISLLFFTNIPNVSSQENNKPAEDSLYRQLQVSFVPYFSTNGYFSDKVTNDVSLNILAGYVKEVRKAEVGGMLNMVRQDAGKCQIAGLGNLVGGTSEGFQAAGTFNMARKLKGVQVAGTLNFAGEASGVQIAGLVNQAAKGKCTQVSGLINNSGDSAVIQIAGLVNNTKGETGLQIAGLVNNASKINNIQVAGLVNNAQNVQGVQISGLVNHASFFNGVQIGIINIADSCHGIPIGLVSWVKNGYHKFEIYGDELFYTNIAFRSGVQKLHGIVTAGITPDKLDRPLWTYGSGMGTSFPLGNKTLFDLDMMFHHIIKTDDVDNNFLYKIYAGIDRILAGKSSVSLGVTYNFLVTDTRQHSYEDQYADIAPYHFSDHTYRHVNMKTWAGLKVGFRF